MSCDASHDLCVSLQLRLVLYVVPKGSAKPDNSNLHCLIHSVCCMSLINCTCVCVCVCNYHRHVIVFMYILKIYMYIRFSLNNYYTFHDSNRMISCHGY